MVNRALEVVRRILNVAHQDWRWLKGVPKIRMLKEPRRRVRFLRREETDRLIEALPEHMKAIVEFALATGCRAGEILGLDWSRVDLTRKGTAPALVIHLRRQTHPAKLHRVGQGEAARRHRGDFRFHDLRHTWASWHVQSGTSLPELMQPGGWKSYEMVLRCAHLTPEKLSFVAGRIERQASKPIEEAPFVKNVAKNATFSLRSR
jgi:integrase